MEFSIGSGRAAAPAPRRDAGRASEPRVVFFGKRLGATCARCGAFASTGTGQKYCAHVTCPIALKELRRRNRKRTSKLETVYIPRLTEER